MDKETFIKSGLIEQYVMGLASPEERAQVEHMAAAHPEIDKHICEMQDCMKQYVEMHCIPPPKRARQRILNTIDEMEQSEKQPKTIIPQAASTKVIQLSRWTAGIAVASVIGLLGACLFLYQNQSAAEAQMSQLSSEFQMLKSRYAQLEKNNSQYTQQYVVLKDVATKHVAMAGTAHAPDAKLVVYWNEAHNAALLNVINLPKAPYGHQYQVWANVNNVHLDLGLLHDLEDEKGMHNLPYMENCKGIVITLEKEGGSPHPSTDMMYAHGEMSL